MEQKAMRAVFGEELVLLRGPGCLPPDRSSQPILYLVFPGKLAYSDRRELWLQSPDTSVSGKRVRGQGAF